MMMKMLKTRTAGLLAAGLLLGSAGGLACLAGAAEPVAPKEAERSASAQFVNGSARGQPR